MYRQLFIILLLSALLAALSGFLHPSTPPFNKPTDPWGVTPSQIASMVEIIWVDARDDVYYDKEHIPGALLLNANGWDYQIESLLDVWEPETNIIVYCSSQSCDESKRIAEVLRTEYGLENVYYLEGGWEAWLETQAR